MLDMILQYLQEPAVVSALLILGDIILSICQYIRTGKVFKKTSSQVCSDDIQALIEYHEKVAKELKNKKVG